MKEKSHKQQRKRIFTPYLLISPHFILFVVFIVFPTVYSIYISFFRWNYIGTPVFVGFDNYYELLISSDSAFYREFTNALKNTLMYVVLSVPLLVGVALLIAAALNSRPKGIKVFQAIFFLPCLLSVSTVALMWRWAFDRTFGLVNRSLGIDVSWVTAEPYFWIAVILMGIWWSVGGSLLVFLAGMSNIPQERYEAAALDGSNALQKFIHVTLPGLANQILFVSVMTTISSFKVYGEVLMFSGSVARPSLDKNVLMISIQQMGFGDSPQAGMASAMAVLLSVVIIVVSLLLLSRNARRRDEDR
jgi:multiple sugar transport system permease protein